MSGFFSHCWIFPTEFSFLLKILFLDRDSQKWENAIRMTEATFLKTGDILAEFEDVFRKIFYHDFYDTLS